MQLHVSHSGWVQYKESEIFGGFSIEFLIFNRFLAWECSRVGRRWKFIFLKCQEEQ